MDLSIGQLLIGILVSILGAAIWELLFKRNYPVFFKIISKFVVFGKDKFEKNIYERIAEGVYSNTYKRFIETLLTAPIVFIMIFNIYPTIGIYNSLKRLEEFYQFKANNRFELSDLKLNREIEGADFLEKLMVKSFYDRNKLLWEDMERKNKESHDVFIEMREYNAKLKENLPLDQKEKIEQKITELLEKYNSIQQDLAPIEKMNLEIHKSGVKYMILVFLPISLIVCIIYLSYIISREYISSAKVHFYQCINICKPYGEKNEIEIIISRFSMMKCKNDFVLVIKSLAEIAEKEKIKLRTYNQKDV